MTSRILSALFLAGAILMAPAIAKDRKLRNNQYFSDSQARTYYKLEAEFGWAQMQYQQREIERLNDELEARDQLGALYDVAARKLEELERFKRNTIEPGCHVVRERAQVKCPKGSHAKRQGLQEAQPTVPPVDSEQELPGTPEPVAGGDEAAARGQDEAAAERREEERP